MLGRFEQCRSHRSVFLPLLAGDWVLEGVSAWLGGNPGRSDTFRHGWYRFGVVAAGLIPALSCGLMPVSGGGDPRGCHDIRDSAGVQWLAVLRCHALSHWFEQNMAE